MRRFLSHALCLAPLLVVAGGCGQRDHSESEADIAVTNSYLECAVRDLCPEETEVLCLAPAGMCPGHFDISPAQVRQLRNCRVLLLFDFQQSVEKNLARLQDRGLRMQRVEAPAGMCIPENYLATCRAVAKVLAGAYAGRAKQFEERLATVEQRLGRLATDLRASVARSSAAAAPVLVSHHQAKFAEWLGLEPVGTFIGSDIETVAGIDQCLKKATGRDIRFVIANRQEGTGLAEALAERRHARAIVFSNFPASCEGHDGFDRLVRDNVGLLLGASGK